MKFEAKPMLAGVVMGALLLQRMAAAPIWGLIAPLLLSAGLLNLSTRLLERLKISAPPYDYRNLSHKLREATTPATGRLILAACILSMAVLLLAAGAAAGFAIRLLIQRHVS